MIKFCRKKISSDLIQSLILHSAKSFLTIIRKIKSQRKKKSSDSKNIDFLEIINLVCFFGFIRFGNNSLFLPVQENKFGSFHKSNLQGQ